MHPQTAVSFQSKHPHRSLWLLVEFPEGNEPRDLLDALEQIGWREDERFARIPPLDGVQEIHVIRKGTGLFTEWTPEEAKKFLPDARRVLRKFGFTKVPHNRLDWAELL